MTSWTAQQEAVFDAVAGSSAHVTVQAVAGAGKTSTSVAAAGKASGTKGFLAFNKHIVAELQERLGGSATASTLHSLGFAAVAKRFPGCSLDEQKLKRLLERLRPRWFYEGRNGSFRGTDEAFAAMQLARLAKYTLTPMNDQKKLTALVDHYGVEMPRETQPIYAAVGDLLEESAKETDRVDFDDMVWFPVRHKMDLTPFDTLFVDEAQDLSKCQQTLALKAGNRMVVIGDARQAIYGFSGSDCDALPNLSYELATTDSGCADRPLTVTFRCPQRHVRLAQQIVPEIEAASGAPLGRLEVLDPKDVPFELMPGDMAISRTNAPLLDLAYRLIASGVPTMVRGRDFGKGLLDLIRRMKADSIRDLVKRLFEWAERETERLERRDAPESAFQSIDDRMQSLQSITSQHSTVQELEESITQLFSDETSTGKVVLSSVHRAKGLEADRVVIVAPDKLFLRFPDTKPWQYEQECNLAYIAVTRARQELFFAGDPPPLLQGVFHGC